MSANKHLNKDQLAYFKKSLLDLKKEVQAKVNDTANNSQTDELADFSNHPADRGTAQFEQERAAGFDLIHKDKLQEIEDSLERIDKGTYGISVVSGKPIPIERLEAVPTAKTLVEEQ